MDNSDFVPFREVFNNSFEETEEQFNSAPVFLNDIEVPWLRNDLNNQNERSYYPLVRLHNEILTFCEYISPTTNELKLRDSVVEELTNIIISLWPTSKVHVFGSQMTKILTPSSDIDLAVVDVPQFNNEDLSSLTIKLANSIIMKNIASYCEAITNAKVPIVKIDHIRSGISVDICINNDSGLQTGNTIKKLVNQFPPLRPLTIILKIFLTQRRLNDTYSGGIGSFLLSCMVASFLQMKAKTSQQLKIAPAWNLGALLLEFFHLYGSSFNYYTVGISIRGGGSYFPKRSRLEADNNSKNSGAQRQNMLWMENPDMPSLDMGRSSFLLPKVRRAFEHAHQCLVAALCDSSHSHSDRKDSSHSQSSSDSSLLSFVIRADDPSLAGRSK